MPDLRYSEAFDADPTAGLSLKDTDIISLSVPVDGSPGEYTDIAITLLQLKSFLADG